VYSNFKQELDYLVAYDKTKRDFQEIVDMPDALCDLFIALALQNKGVLSKKKREAQFSMLTPQEVQALEEIVRHYFFNFFTSPRHE